ncbi:MAG: hypothetical protein HOC63_11805 [Rhodospirillales bacterium]|jgi:hypothetical protein|nr:hypothetical protein [Rhodospirillales bacterium]MBT4627362.1 hypothetical protein [Rhodospirillales bacterium]MBT5350904.1 hypothetical protein [Rhodospirillales bacterium]MBT7147025.1 hypothetical protein [Rhodospirillales bacterium]MBT7779949.1 hypothetical protein [Rhodospirillales bacterium]
MRVFAGFLVAMALLAAGDAEAKTTYYKCNTQLFKLEEPWIGKDKFSVILDGKITELELKSVSPEIIEFRWAEYEILYWLNRITGEGNHGAKCKVVEK